jgi:hypothetical protein
MIVREKTFKRREMWLHSSRGEKLYLEARRLARWKRV